MIDIDIFRKRPELIREAMANRYHPSGEKLLSEILKIDGEWKTAKNKTDELRAERNKITNEVAKMKKEKEEEKAQKFMKQSKSLGDEILESEKKEKELEEKRNILLLSVPNLPYSSVPIGKDETENPTLREWGKPLKFKDDVLSHDELGIREKTIDFEKGAVLSGHRFVVTRGWVARLERALINFMLDMQVKNGYEEYSVPHMVRSEIIQGTGQLPKFAEELYKCDEDKLWLIPTSEVPLIGMYINHTFSEEELPKKLTSCTPCYRREAGSYGKDIKGMIRMHQFNKVELVKITLPEESWKEHEKMLSDAEKILQMLELPYRTVTLCTGDLGFASAKTYDIEVWLPSQDKYREISSVSDCRDFQARRLNLKVRRGGKTEFVHTLNGSSLGMSRALIAIIENFQEKEGLLIPKALRDYVGEDFIKFSGKK